MNLSLPKLLAIFALSLFGVIGIIALFKKSTPNTEIASQPALVPIEIDLTEHHSTVVKADPPPIAVVEIPKEKKIDKQAKIEPKVETPLPIPEVDRINELFQTHDPKLPIVETITYKSHVPWQKGRPAWLSDYASHYRTSRHFIARSLNRKADYFTQEVKEGDRFNVLKKDMPFQFYLLVDSSRCMLWFYYIDLNTHEKVLIKTYKVGLGRIDTSKNSGLLTPYGIYELGNRIATYKPKMMGTYQGKKTEMVTIFGTRWIPFEKEIGDCTASAKGFGLHGTPWKPNQNGILADTKNGLGLYESDGCIRLATEDIEEIFAVIVTKPSFIEIVPDFFKAKFNGK